MPKSKLLVMVEDERESDHMEYFPAQPASRFIESYCSYPKQYAVRVRVLQRKIYHVPVPLSKLYFYGQLHRIMLPSSSHVGMNNLLSLHSRHNDTKTINTRSPSNSYPCVPLPRVHSHPAPLPSPHQPPQPHQAHPHPPTHPPSSPYPSHSHSPSARHPPA